MMPVYRHTQIGYVTLSTLLLAAIPPLAAARIPIPGLHSVMSFVTCLLFACALLLPTLTTTVTHVYVACHFGFGIIRRRIPLADLASASVVRNSWLSGWGVRLTPTGWMWNVSGLDAVELQFRDGRRFRIGSDDAEQLCAAIQGQLASRSRH